jgi:hypothetical protein
MRAETWLFLWCCWVTIACSSSSRQTNREVPSLAASSSGLGVAWHDTRDGAGLQIYFARLDPTGARVGSEVRLSDLQTQGGSPVVAANGGAYAIAWLGAPGSGGEALWASVGATGTVAGPVALSASGNTAGSPALIARGTGYAVAWSDGRDGDREVYVKELDATGAVTSREIRVSNDATASDAPTLASSSIGHGVAWTNDPTETTGEVLFATVCP